MNAIQRWWLHFDGGGSEEFKQEPTSYPSEQWCKAKDVETLEKLVHDSVAKATRARADRTISEDLVKSLRVEVIEKDNLILNQEIEITRLKEIEWMYAELLT